MMQAIALDSRFAAMENGKFGSLTFSRPSLRRGDNGRLHGVFKCACGKEIELALSRVKAGTRTHCGCQANTKPNLQHGLRNSPTYRSWSAMKRRCLVPEDKDYYRYGAVGVTVFEAWTNSFEAFYAHLGPRPDDTTLDRIDNNRGYEPGNVKWSTDHEQAINRSDSWYVQIGATIYESMEAAAKAHSVTTMTIIRWCDGYTDPRRLHQASHTKPPRPDCKRWRKYAD